MNIPHVANCKLIIDICTEGLCWLAMMYMFDSPGNRFHISLFPLQICHNSAATIPVIFHFMEI